MPIAYKLTDQIMKTYNGFQWELNIAVPPLDGKGDLCSEHWYHFYRHPLLAVLHNPIHANIKNPRLFKCKVGGKFLDDSGMKCGYTKATIIEELPLPKITTTQRAAYGILVSPYVYKEENYVKWAKGWLSGKDRTRKEAKAAVWVTAAAARAAQAAEAAARAAARAAAWAAAWAAAVTNKDLGETLVKCAKKAMKY